MTLAEIAKGYYRAFETQDRAFVENNLAEGFTFTSPFDDAIGRDEYFARCWAQTGMHAKFHFEMVAEEGDQVVVVYRCEMNWPNAVHPGMDFRNAEKMVFEGGKLKSVTVFFGYPPNGLTRRQFAVQSGAA